MTKLGRIFSLLVGICTCLSDIPAHAGAASAVSCSGCATTTDFANAAINQYYSDYGGQYYPTTYAVISTSHPMTAYMAVLGGYIWVQEQGFSYQYFVPPAAYPVDSNGNGITGSEIVLEQGYAIVDQVIFGANRGAPEILNPNAVINVDPSDPVWSFPNSDDQQVGNWIDSFLYNYIARMENGDFITLTFHDGTVATYQLFIGVPGVHTWVWIKATKNGVPIGKDGNPLPNPNPNPQPAPGGVTFYSQFAQLGPAIDGQVYSWLLQGSGICVDSTDVRWGGESSVFAAFVPCPN